MTLLDHMLSFRLLRLSDLRMSLVLVHVVFGYANSTLVTLDREYLSLQMLQMESQFIVLLF